MFNHPDIHIQDPVRVERLLEALRTDNTRVVADFDSTITIHSKLTSWALLKQIEALPKEYHEKAAGYYAKYHPYENDSSLSMDEHDRLMQEWWGLHLGLFREYGLRSEHIESIDASLMQIRDGLGEAFGLYQKLSVPVLVLSAGVAQTIEKTLNAHHLMGVNVSLTANRILFDSTGNYVGIDPPRFIHVGNKDEAHTSEKIQESFRGRTRIILMGDNLQDIKMVKGEERENTLAIGFCNSDKIEFLTDYKRVFDIVVVSDTSDHGVLQYINRHIDGK